MFLQAAPAKGVEMSADFLAYTSMGIVTFMFVALVGVLYIVRHGEKAKKKENGVEKTERGKISKRAVQFMASVLVLPTVVLLALNGRLSSEVVGTLLGTFIGYVLSGLGDGRKGEST